MYPIFTQELLPRGRNGGLLVGGGEGGDAAVALARFGSFIVTSNLGRCKTKTRRALCHQHSSSKTMDIRRNSMWPKRRTKCSFRSKYQRRTVAAWRPRGIKTIASKKVLLVDTEGPAVRAPRLERPVSQVGNHVPDLHVPRPAALYSYYQE